MLISVHLGARLSGTGLRPLLSTGLEFVCCRSLQASLMVFRKTDWLSLTLRVASSNLQVIGQALKVHKVLISSSLPLAT